MLRMHLYRRVDDRLAFDIRELLLAASRELLLATYRELLLATELVVQSVISRTFRVHSESTSREMEHIRAYHRNC